MEEYKTNQIKLNSCRKKLLIFNNILQFFVDLVDFNVILSDKIQAICRWLVFYPTKLC